MNIKIIVHIMPWEIDYALLSFSQLKHSSNYIPSGVNVEEERQRILNEIQKTQNLDAIGRKKGAVIEELRARLRSARAKMFAAKKSPEDRQAAAQKALKTKAKNEKDSQRRSRESEKYEALTKKQNKERKDANKLPLEIPTNGRVGAIQTELGDMERYYDIVRSEIDTDYYPEFYRGGIPVYNEKRTVFVLNPKYKDKSFAKAKIAWSVWEQFYGKL